MKITTQQTTARRLADVGRSEFYINHLLASKQFSVYVKFAFLSSHRTNFRDSYIPLKNDDNFKTVIHVSAN